ncbi:conjugal transfer protein [Streptomyces sp. NPDC026589]|uniref:conjugal transfer protein n=1 Tax=Streptomyces sp. NPDC026589 TaxID=3155609 RepID=UPI00340E156B
MRRREERVREERLPAEAGGWSVASLGASANAVTVMRRSMWALLVAGPVLGVWALLSAPAVVVSASQSVRQDRAGAEEGAGPGGFAELFLSAYLTAGEGTESVLAPFLPTARDVVLEADAGSQTVERLAAVKVRRADGGGGYWSVTVAALVKPASDEAPGGGRGAKSGSGGTGAASQAGVLRYFQVPVKAGKGGAWSAVALPAEVGAPVPSRAEALGYGSSAPANGSDAAVQTLAGFFSAFLAGAGDLDRYLSPGTSLAPVSPPPYGRVEVVALAETGSPSGAVPDAGVMQGQERQLLVDVAATDVQGQKRPLVYAVSLVARDGRWEIASVEGAPVLGSPGSKQEGEVQ